MKIASKAAGKKTTVDRTILPWTEEEEEEERERFGSWGRKLWLETMWSPHDQTTFATTFVSMDLQLQFSFPLLPNQSLRAASTHTAAASSSSSSSSPHKQTRIPMSAIHSNRAKKNERNQMVVLMAAAHVIEMGFFFELLEQIQVQDFWKTHLSILR